MPSTVTIAALSDATEGGAAGTFRLTRDGDTSQQLVVFVMFSGTATPGSDISFPPSQVLFAANAATADVTITAIDDSTTEPTETAVLTIMGGGGGYTVGSPNTATVNIIDNDGTSPPPPPPTVTFGTSSDASEGGPAGSFALNRTGDLSQSLTVSFGTGGTATPTSDYTSFPNQVTFAAGSATATITVSAVDDTEAESTETVVLTLTSGAGYTVGTPGSATVNIFDNDNVAPPPAQVVNTSLDIVNPNDAFLSLREAITAANDATVSGQQRITFAPNLNGQTVWLDDELPEIEKNIFIDGQGRDPIIRRDDTKGSFRLLSVKAGADLKLSHLTLSSGYVDQALAGGLGGGGAIWAKGHLTADYCSFIGNGVSSDIEFGAGGAIWCSGQTAANGLVIGLLELSHCTFSCNWAPYGGAVATGGRMQLTQISDSTFSQNTAAVTGGALYLTNQDDTDQPDSIAQLSHCTIDDNQAGRRGGGIYAEYIVLQLEGGIL